MKRRALIPALFLAAAAGGLAGCTTAPGTTATPSATPTTPAAPTCPAGNWTSTGVAATTSVGTVPVTLQGGSDVKTTIGGDGAVTADFTGMKPVVYSATVAGSEVTGEFTYAGSVKGTLSGASGAASSSASATASTSSAAATPTTSASASNGSAATSTWSVGQVNWGDLKLTAKLTKPVPLTVIDNVKLTDVSGTQTTALGNVVDLQPLLRSGVYSCGGNDRLTITPSGTGGPAVAWTFARV